MKIIIDPGHGGKDSGAVSPNGLKEKDVNLALALTLKYVCSSQGVDAELTRTDDSFIALKDRIHQGDKFISIHCNSAETNRAAGTETLYAKSYSETLAKKVQKALLGFLKTTDRKSKIPGRSLFVLRKNTIPAVLIELGFLSNPSDEAKLRRILEDKEYRLELAKEILKASI